MLSLLWLGFDPWSTKFHLPWAWQKKKEGRKRERKGWREEERKERREGKREGGTERERGRKEGRKEERQEGGEKLSVSIKSPPFSKHATNRFKNVR